MDEFDASKMLGKIQRLRDTNSRIVDEIESYGAAVDLNMARLEHLFKFFVEAGIMTEEQHLTEEYRWQMDLKQQLVPAVQRAREAYAKAREQAQRAFREAQNNGETKPPDGPEGKVTSVRL